MKTSSAMLMFGLIVAAAPHLRAGEENVDSGTLRSPLAEQLNAAASRAAGEKYDLKYNFTDGESVRYRVEHLVTVDTTIENNRQRARSRSLSTKVWDVRQVHDDGAATFLHQVADADMWHQVTGFITQDGKQVAKEKEHRYNSTRDEEPPPHYKHVAASIGKPLAEVTIDAQGALKERKDQLPGATWGGQLIVPLPPEPVAVGHQWHQPHEIVVRQRGGTVKRVKTRQRYELAKVEGDIATIAYSTQILTPGIREQPRVMVQIVQRLTEGVIEFDIKQGRIIRQKLKLDETVIGFNGPKSIMNYAGRFTEELLTDDGEIARTAAK